MNAKTIDAKILNFTDQNIEYKSFSKQDKKSKFIKASKVYMLSYENGKEKFIYKKNPDDPYSLEQEEMRFVISGMQDAKQYFRATGNFFSGIAFGFLGGFIGDLRLAPVPPIIFATISEMHAPCLSKQQLSYCFDLCNENYVSGYMRKAGNKKINNSLIGGLIGIVPGYIVSKLFDDPFGTLLSKYSGKE